LASPEDALPRPKYISVRRDKTGVYMYFLDLSPKVWMGPIIEVAVESPRAVEIRSPRPVGYVPRMSLGTFRRMVEYIDEQLGRLERLVDLFREVAGSYFRGVLETWASTTETVIHRFDWGPDEPEGSFWAIRVELYVRIEAYRDRYVVMPFFEVEATVHMLENTEYWGAVKNMFRTLAEVLDEPKLADPPTTLTSPKFVTIHREEEAFRLVRRPR
jgi:hypothetical protein